MKRRYSPVHRFEPARDVTWARYAREDEIPFPPPRIRGSSARARGMRYERKVVAELAERYPGLLANCWIKFQDGADGTSRTRFCQPDAFWLDKGRRELLIFEIKLHHTEQAWWQLFELYSPVLCKIFSGYTVKPCEVVRVYDCRTNANCPEDPVLVRDLNDLRANSFNVHILYR